MRVVVVGATGNVGAATVRALAADPAVEAVVGVARRLPGRQMSMNSKVSWRAADISCDNLDLVEGVDSVVHLAWKIQPSHHETDMLRTNVLGTKRLVDAVLRHRVPSFVYASSVGTYAPAPKSPRVDESWPATGIVSSTYSRHKAAVESILDRVARANQSLRLVRMRTSLVFQRSAASEIHRLFLGPLMPWHVPRMLRAIPSSDRLAFQVTHADDVADAYRRAVLSDVSGAFNIAAEPVLTAGLIATAIEGRTAPIPMSLVRAGTQASYALRLQRSEAGWLDMALQTPLMDTSKARSQLGWTPSTASTDALIELLRGIGDGAGDDTQPLKRR